MSGSKKCPSCKETKSLDLFPVCSANKNGRKSECKECNRERSRRYYHRYAKNNPDHQRRAREKARAHYWKDPESRRREAKRWREQNHERFKSYLRNWYRENREHALERNRARYQAKRDEIQRVNKAWHERNKEHVRGYKLAWHHANKDRPEVTRRLALRRLLWNYLRKLGETKNSRTFQVLGYTAGQLKQRMECQFQPGMSWDNHGEWHIDHRIPVSWFIARGETRPHIVNALSNLKPVWAFDNLSKNNRWAG